MRALPAVLVLAFLSVAHAQVSVSAFNTITPNATVSDLAVVESGGVVVVGRLSPDGTADFDGDGALDIVGQASGAGYVARYDASGDLLWARPIGATSGDPSDISGVERVALGADGTVYLGGVFDSTLDLDGDGTADLLSPADGPDLFVASYTSGGALRWGRQGGTQSDGSATTVTGLLLDGSRLLVAATFSAPLDLDGDGTPEAEPEVEFRPNGAVLEYSLGGDVQGLWRLAGTRVSVRGIARLADGGFAVGGQFQERLDADDDGTPDETTPSEVGTDAFVAAFTGAGALRWSHAVRAENSEDEIVSAMTADEAGRLYVGFTSIAGGVLDLDDDGTADIGGSPALIGAYEADGTVRWGQRVDGLLPIVSRLGVAASTLYAGGLLALPFEATDGESYVAAFDLDGFFLGEEVVRIGVEASAGTTSHGLLATGAAGQLVVAGRFNGAVDFDGDGTPETPEGTRGAYVFVPGLLPVPTEPGPASGAALSVAPNPSAQPSVRLSLMAPEAVRVTVHDALGREVAVLHDGPLARDAAWPLPALAPGVYVVRAVTPEATMSARATVVR